MFWTRGEMENTARIPFPRLPGFNPGSTALASRGVWVPGQAREDGWGCMANVLEPWGNGNTARIPFPRLPGFNPGSTALASRGVWVPARRPGRRERCNHE